MNVDGAESQARQLAKKRKEVEDEQNKLELEKSRTIRQREKDKVATNEKIDRDIVEISKAGEQQMDMVKKMNSERVRAINENTQKDFEKVAADTAKTISATKESSLKAIEDVRRSSVDRVNLATDQSANPFYRINSLTPVVTDGEGSYVVKMAMPEEESKNLFVSGNGPNSLKVSLARRFQETAKFPEESRSTKNSSFQTIVETLNFPEAYDAKGISREYADGIVTITVPKLNKPTPNL